MKIQIVFPEDMTAELERRKTFPRDSMAETVREGISRYLYLLNRARQEILNKFSGEELSLMADICNGTFFGPGELIAGAILADAEDAEPHYYRKWGVDREQLLTTLRSLSPAEDAALVDAIERFWAGVSSKPSLEQPDPKKLLEQSK